MVPGTEDTVIDTAQRPEARNLQDRALNAGWAAAEVNRTVPVGTRPTETTLTVHCAGCLYAVVLPQVSDVRVLALVPSPGGPVMTITGGTVVNAKAAEDDATKEKSSPV